MSINKLFMAGLACIASFMWGMAVDKNDQRALAAYDAQMEMDARLACGPGHMLATSLDGLACIDRSGNRTRLVGVQQ